MTERSKLAVDVFFMSIFRVHIKNNFKILSLLKKIKKNYITMYKDSLEQ